MIDIRIEIKHEIREAFKKLYNYSCSLDLISIDDTQKILRFLYFNNFPTPKEIKLFA